MKFNLVYPEYYVTYYHMTDKEEYVEYFMTYEEAKKYYDHAVEYAICANLDNIELSTRKGEILETYTQPEDEDEEE